MNSNVTTTTATATANTTTSPVTAGSSSMPDLRRAYPVMISRMLSTTPRPGSRGHGRVRDESPQPSTSRASAGHGAGMLSSAAKRGRFVGSPAPRLAAPLPRAAATPFATAPNHEAFRDVGLCFKANVMRLRVWKNRIVLEMASSPSSKGMMLERAEWDILTQQKDTIDHHVTKTTTDTSEEDCVRVWVALKDRGNAVAYVTVKTFGKKVYVDIRDYWYPNGLQGGITPTKRGVCLNLEGWLTLVQEMDTIEELWFDAEQYLRRQPVIIGGPVDSSDEGSQLVVLDWFGLFAWYLGSDFRLIRAIRTYTDISVFLVVCANCFICC